MRVLVCGSRTWDDDDAVAWVLDGIAHNEDSNSTPMVVIEGGAKGADAAAARWCDGFGTEYPQAHEQYPADWTTHGKAAGPIRNMVNRAWGAGIPVYVVEKFA